MVGVVCVLVDVMVCGVCMCSVCVWCMVVVVRVGV